MRKKSQQMGSIAVLKWIFTFIRPYTGWFIFSLFMFAGVIGANLVKAYFIQRLVDHSLKGQLKQVLMVVASFSLIILGGAIFSYLSKLATGKFSLYALRDLKEELATQLSQMQFKYLAQQQSGDLVTRLNNDTEMLYQLIKGTLPNFTVQVVLGIGACIYIFVVNWKLLLVSILFLPIAMVMAYYLNQQAGKYYPKSYQYFGSVSGEVEQSLLGVDLIKAFTLRGLFSKKIRQGYQQVFQADIQAQKYVAVLQPVCYAIANFPGIIGLVYGARLATQGEIGIGTLIGVLQLYEFIIIPAVSLPFVMNRIQQCLAASERVAEILELPRERVTPKEVKLPATEQQVQQEPLLRFIDISFRYDEATPVLQGISFDLASSQMVALVGASGSGKSTIINLISGLYEAEQGEIQFRGIDLRKWNLRSFREQIAVVSQDTYLFPATIEENIRYGQPNATREHIISAAKAAFAHEFIQQMPAGYQTLIGEGGLNLSGGQRQRLAIARAFLKKAPLILLDEPTSALDHHSESLIQRSVERLAQDSTVLVIAHRLSTIRQADQIIVLDAGQIVERGTHHQLVSQKGYYYRLYNNQFSA